MWKEVWSGGLQGACVGLVVSSHLVSSLPFGWNLAHFTRWHQILYSTVHQELLGRKISHYLAIAHVYTVLPPPLVAANYEDVKRTYNIHHRFRRRCALTGERALCFSMCSKQKSAGSRVDEKPCCSGHTQHASWGGFSPCSSPVLPGLRPLVISQECYTGRLPSFRKGSAHFLDTLVLPTATDQSSR